MLNFCYLEYQLWSRATPVGHRGLRSVTQVLTPLSLQREVLESPVVLPGEPPLQVSYLLTPTMEEPLHGEKLQPWKAGDAGACVCVCVRGMMSFLSWLLRPRHF